MRRILQTTSTLLLVWCCSLFGLQQARASHAQAGQLTYTYMSTDATTGAQMYRVQMQFFRDCSGILLGSPVTVEAVNSCGGAVRSVNLTQIGQPTIGNPYCPSIQATVPCSTTQSVSSNFPNYVTYIYEGNIVLPPAAEWILSFEENARPGVANLTTQSTLRLEARLNSLITPMGGGPPIVVTNSSPVFSTTNLPVPFVYVNQESTVTFAAVDPDRTNGRADSLVYSLDRPLTDCGSFATYAAYPGTGCQPGIDPLCATRIIRCNGIAANYSATLPIPVANDTIRSGAGCNPGVVTFVDIRPKFTFNPSSGSFTFTPNLYIPMSPSAQGRNKYAVVGKVTEYRKLNGVYYIVGSARRDFLVIVNPDGGNVVPGIPGSTVGPRQSGATVNVTRDTTDVNIFTCNYSRVRFDFTDPNNTGANPPMPLQNLSVFFPADVNTSLLQGGDIGQFLLSGNGTPTPSVTLFFQPTRAAAGTIVFIPIRIEDNGCPVKGVQFRVIRVIIRGRPRAAQAVIGTGQGLGNTSVVSVCAGGAIDLNGSVDRPDSIRNVATGISTLQNYIYRWQALNGTAATAGLTGVRLDTANLTVRPTVTTRYRLYIDPTQGFGPGTCGDTTSVLVKVVPPPTVALATSDSVICAGAPVMLTATVARPDSLTDNYAYIFTDSRGRIIAGTDSTRQVRPDSTTTYTVMAISSDSTRCEATGTITIQVAPPAVALSANDTLVCAGSPVNLRAVASRGDNFTDTYTYTFTGGDLPPVGQVGANVTVNPTVPTTYTVVARGASSGQCEARGTIRINVAPAAVATFVKLDSVSATPGTNRLVAPLTYRFENRSTLTPATPGFTVARAAWTYQRIRDAAGRPVTEAAVPFSNSLTIASVSLANPGTYAIRLRVNTQSGGTDCPVAEQVQNVVVPDVVTPNIITPNNDGLNDVFIVSSAQRGGKLLIFNRWGRKLEEMDNYQNTWDGGNHPDGVYYYQLVDAQGGSTKGWLEVARSTR